MNLQNTELKNAISATALKSQYDACAKRLLGNKNILAHILVRTVEEFKGMHPEDVLSLIEGTPYISSVPAEPGLTNRSKCKFPKGTERQTGTEYKNLAND